MTEAVSRVEGVTRVDVTLDVMSDEQRRELASSLRGGQTDVADEHPGAVQRMRGRVERDDPGHLVGRLRVPISLLCAFWYDTFVQAIAEALHLAKRIGRRRPPPARQLRDLRLPHRVRPCDRAITRPDAAEKPPSITTPSTCCDLPQPEKPD